MSMTNRTHILDAIVELARSIRGDWDVPGLRTAIRKCFERDVQPTIAQVAYAVIHCAENPVCRTPAIIPLDGPHWRETTTRGETEPLRARRHDRMWDDGKVPCGGIHLPGSPCDGQPGPHAEHIAAMREIARLAKRPDRIDGQEDA